MREAPCADALPPRLRPAPTAGTGSESPGMAAAAPATSIGTGMGSTAPPPASVTSARPAYPAPIVVSRPLRTRAGAVAPARPTGVATSGSGRSPHRAMAGPPARRGRVGSVGKRSSPCGTGAVNAVRPTGSAWAGSARPRAVGGRHGRWRRVHAASGPRVSGCGATARPVTGGSVRTTRRTGSRARSARDRPAWSGADVPPVTTTGAERDGSGP
jgi:hypothetical protein